MAFVSWFSNRILRLIYYQYEHKDLVEFPILNDMLYFLFLLLLLIYAFSVLLSFLQLKKLRRHNELAIIDLYCNNNSNRRIG